MTGSMRTRVAGLVARIRATGWLRGGRGGFLLLESLVGVALMALILTMLPSSIVTSRETIQKSANLVAARLVAEAVLTAEFTTIDLAAGVRNGVLDGFQWAALVRPRPDLQQQFKGKDWVPYEIAVTVEVADSRRLTVETLRLGKGG